MAASKDELAQALEAMSSGPAAAQSSDEQPQEHLEKSSQSEQLRAAAHISHTTRPLPGKPAAPASEMHRQAPAADRGVYFRQTIIPPLLTLGTFMPLAGVASLIMGEDSPLGEQKLVPALLVLIGLLILGVAALNMLQIRHALSASSKR